MHRLVGFVLISMLLALPATADWSHLRGARHDGRAASGAFEGERLTLSLAWRAPLGSGYSGIVVQDGRAVTMFTEGDSDWLAAFDSTTGEPLWRHSLGALFKGQDGADDGPLSTPAISDGVVYAIAPRGELKAVKLESGELIWAKSLPDAFGAAQPEYGFSSSPLVFEGTLIVQAGGKGDKSIVGLDKKSGKLIWSDGDAGVSYQSPALLELAGKMQVVAARGTSLAGYDPASGTPYWTLELGEGYLGSANPTPVGPDRFLVYVSGAAAVFKVTEQDGTMTAAELYRTPELGRTYAPPVHHQGHLYGFKDEFLSCLDAETGERVWRSRPPGGRGLLLVNDTLVIYAAQGHVVLARATPEGYQERASFKVFEGSAYTWPSFSDDRIYVRNLQEIAALSVGRSEIETPVRAAGDRDDHEFARWLKSIEKSEDRAAEVDALLERHKVMPIIDGDTVTFLFRSDAAADLAIAGTMLDSGFARPMERVAGTPLFHSSFRLPQACRFEYRFQIDFDEWRTDPLNPREVPPVEGPGMLSEFFTPGYEPAPYLGVDSVGAGRMDEFKLTSAILEGEKSIKVWLPPGYDDADADYPLLLVNDGDAWLEHGRLVAALEYHVAHGGRAAVVAFVSPSPEWWVEAGGSRTAEYARMQAEELLPALQARYRLFDVAAQRAVMGNRFYGFSAAYAALKHPEAFGAAAMQSVYFGLGAEDELESLIAAKANPELRIYIDWSQFEERSVDTDFDIGKDSARLASLFETHGYRIDGGLVIDSYGWGGWRNRSGRLLSALFPAE